MEKISIFAITILALKTIFENFLSLVTVAKRKYSKFEAGLKGDVDLSRIIFFYVLRWVAVEERFILKISCAKATIKILLTDKSIM